MNIELIKKSKCFGGSVEYYSHQSDSTKTPMKFSVFIPEKVSKLGKERPALIWLSGLTCTEENFITKAGVFPWASEQGLTIICPDTSPRGTNLPLEHESYDLGSGAGFYINATQSPWSDHYRMYDYIVKEIPEILTSHFSVGPDRLGISGHSMGGHGALMIALKNKNLFQSVSAFSPIVAPTQCAWGHKAFENYLGNDQSTWEEYDSVCLLDKAEGFLPTLIDQGLDDEFFPDQLKTSLWEEKVLEKGLSGQIQTRKHEGYDHSYFFIASFIKDHIEFHAQYLCKL